MKNYTLLFLSSLLLACPPKPPLEVPKPLPPAVGEASISAASILLDVKTLSDPSWEGRGPNTAGVDKAADYIAARMKEAGLQPGAPNGTFFQPFEVTVDAKVEDKTVLKDPSGSRWLAPYDFQPLGFSENGSVEAEVVFVGYGLKLDSRDDFAGLDVKDKIVAVIRGVPDELEKDEKAREQATLRSKAAAAKDRGAKAIIFVSQAPKDKESSDDPLIPLRVQGRIGGGGILAIHVRQAILRGWLMQNGVSPIGAEATKPRALKTKLSLDVELSAIKASLRNVIGKLPGTSNNGEAVVLGAHYDHLGYGGAGSLAPEKTGTVHTGADDNASGTATLLAIAKAAATSAEKPDRDLYFCAFSGEEMGLLGSDFFVKNPSLPVEKMRAMLNMDMVGRMKESNLAVLGAETATEWKDLLEKSKGDLPLNLKPGNGGYGPSDHTSFYIKGVPVLHFFTGTHEDYHKPSDTWEKINSEGQALVGKLVLRMAEKLAEIETPLTVIKTAPPSSSGGDRGYGAYLGTIPEFGYVGKGVRLGGVAAGGPAEKAGIKGGDVILEMLGKKVDSLEDLTRILREQKPGDEIEILILRETQELKVKAILGKRSQ